MTIGWDEGPVSARRHQGNRRYRQFDAVTMLTVYLVLLCAVPSNLTLGVLGSLGRPAFLWGIVLAFWWLVHQLQAQSRATLPVWQPIRLAFAAVFVIALISFAAAMLRGQPADQVSPALSGLLRLVSWAGVVFIAIDGIRTMADLRTLMRRFVIAGALMAGLGLLQFATGQALVDLISIPGFVASEEGGAQARGSFIRAAGTATHPLEYAVLLCMCLPLALAFAVSPSPTSPRKVPAFVRWIPAALIGISILVSASRSALLGFAAAALVMLPGLPRRTRAVLAIGGLALVAVVVVAVPGMLGTMLSLFTGASSDPSALSRTNGLARAPGFIAVSPIVGTGFGTFLPRYYIFDNEWVLLTVELGILGIIAIAGLVVAALWSAYAGRLVSSNPDVRIVGQGLIASVVTAAVLFAGFDGLSFPISAGAFFFVIGLCGALRTVADADASFVSRPRWLPARSPEFVPPADIAPPRRATSTGAGRKEMERG